MALRLASKLVSSGLKCRNTNGGWELRPDPGEELPKSLGPSGFMGGAPGEGRKKNNVKERGKEEGKRSDWELE